MPGSLRRFYKIIPGRPPILLGEGKEGKVTEVTLKSPFFKKRMAAQKEHGVRISALDKDFVRAEVVFSKKVWHDFKNAGLPVTAFYTPILRRKSKHYLTILMENLKSKYGELIPINNADGEPVFLSQLSISKDHLLIKELARDFSTMRQLGYGSNYMDYWHFYKKPDGTYGRVIIDLTRIKRTHAHSPSTFRHYMGQTEFDLFHQEYLRHSGELD